MALTALTERRTLWGRITCYPSPRRWVALHTYLLYIVVTYTHHQNDMCVTLFPGAAVMLKPFTQRLEMYMPFSGREPHFTSPRLLYIGRCTLPIYVQFWDVVTYHNTVFVSDTWLAIAFASPLSHFTGRQYTVKSSHSLVLCTHSSTFCVDPLSSSDASSSSSTSASLPSSPSYPFDIAGSQGKPLKFSHGPSSPAGGGDGISLVAFITFIFVIPAAPWHPEMQFVICAIVVYRDVWVSASDLRLLKRYFGGQIVKMNRIVKSRCFHADDLCRRWVLGLLDLMLDCCKSVFIHPLLVALRYCDPGSHQECIHVCNARRG